MCRALIPRASEHPQGIVPDFNTEGRPSAARVFTPSLHTAVTISLTWLQCLCWASNPPLKDLLGCLHLSLVNNREPLASHPFFPFLRSTEADVTLSTDPREVLSGIFLPGITHGVYCLLAFRWSPILQHRGVTRSSPNTPPPHALWYLLFSKRWNLCPRYVAPNLTLSETTHGCLWMRGECMECFSMSSLWNSFPICFGNSLS